ncbi:MAG: Gfo/Idh/MocA family oxidoreductase [Capsulimonadales bacterium]|nr:Gfo/Idh/MocA family oxidoreductase [Capsulimonadales bacterium]
MNPPALGVGIVGFGMIGKVHAFAHRSLPLFYDPLPVATRLVGVCTSRPETAEKAQAQAGFDLATTDLAELLEHPGIDIIHCCTPNDAHRDLLLAAIAAGKHVYCDKPLTRTVPEAEEVLAAAIARPERIYRMTFNYRFAPATLRAKQLVEEGFLGEIFQFRGEYLHAGYIDPNRPRSWRTEWARSGGGAVMDLGVHIFDLLRWLVGEMEVESAKLVTRIPSRPHPKTGEPVPVDVDDLAVAQVRTTEGAVGVIEASRLATGVQDELRFEIHGSRGAIAWNLMDPDFLSIYDARIPEGPLGGARGPQRIECVTRYPKPYAFGGTKNTLGWPQLHVHCLYDFIATIAGKADTGPTFTDGLAAQRWVADCQRLGSTLPEWRPS